MKTLLTATVAVAALFVAAPAFAGSGQIDAAYTDVSSGDATLITVGGKAVVDAGQSWVVQGDVATHRVDFDAFFGDKLNYTDAALHLAHRTDALTVGAYVDTTDAFMMSAYGLGVEAQKNFEKVSVNGSLGYNTVEGGFFLGDKADGWNATAGATFFVTDNFSFGADYGHIDIEDADADVWSLDAEYQLDTAPVSFFAGYRKQTESMFAGDDVSSWTLGARWNFGGGSLKQREHTGASLKGGLSFSSLVF